jgi:hypothetical protein
MDIILRRRNDMTLVRLASGVIVSALIAISAITVAVAQTSGGDPHHPDSKSAQVAQTPETDDTMMPDQGMQSGQPGMMGRDMTQSGMMGRMPMRAMRGQMMKFMFAIADADGDNALSFEEVTTVHKRIFDKVDGDKNGKVTQEEMRSFMRD